jgi:hypothetical protein
VIICNLRGRVASDPSLPLQKGRARELLSSGNAPGQVASLTIFRLARTR